MSVCTDRQCVPGAVRIVSAVEIRFFRILSTIAVKKAVAKRLFFYYNR